MLSIKLSMKRPRKMLPSLAASFFFLLASCVIPSGGQTLNFQDFVIVVLSQQEPYDISLAEDLRNDLVKQSKTQSQVPPPVHFAHADFDHPGAWTILPVIPQLDVMYGKNCSYILFCLSSTTIHLNKLIQIFQKKNPQQEKWFGHALRDDDPTIIHHFAFPKNPSIFKYPNLASGLVISQSLLRRLAHRLRDKDFPKSADFSIDASHELALYIWQEGKGPEMTHVDSFCAKPGPHCVIKPKVFLPCANGVLNTEIYFAVKTCSKYHKERLPVVKATWGKHSSRIGFFSDVEDPDSGTISLGIPNTERGHCGKTLAILGYAANQLSADPSLKWLVIADDDTILSVARLQQLLSCYNATSKVALGERYGFSVSLPFSNGGYNYITGGGGIVLSMPLVRDLALPNRCTCPDNSTPDDMYLGICLANMNVPVIHSPNFHQARPSDYARNYLVSQKPVSFHKHWMVDPIKVYKDWFEADDISFFHKVKTEHTEL